MKEFKKPIIEIIEIEEEKIILCSGGSEGYGPDIPVIDDPDIW